MLAFAPGAPQVVHLAFATSDGNVFKFGGYPRTHSSAKLAKELNKWSDPAPKHREPPDLFRKGPGGEWIPLLRTAWRLGQCGGGCGKRKQKWHPCCPTVPTLESFGTADVEVIGVDWKA